jgi:precorrin-4/cobalt-precorrin-4 C11-methyltransferase
MDILDRKGIEYDTTPGVSSFCGAAAVLNMEYTLPGISQSVIITRIDGRTGVPERESVEALSSHGATMVFFLSAGQTKRLSDRLISAGVSKDTPCALVYRATWPDEQKYVCTLEQLPQVAKEHNIDRQALIIVGQAVAQSGYELSKLYAPSFTTGYRKGKDADEK